MTCPFAAPGRQEACLSLQKQRSALMTREYDRNECYSCPMRRKRLEGAKPPERIAIPAGNISGRTAAPVGAGRVERDTIPPSGDTKPAIPETIQPKPETIIPKKEEQVDQEKVKENILRVLGRKGPMTISNLKLFAAAEESKENFRAAVDALAGEGKVVTKEGARAGSLHVAFPGAAAPSNDATVPSKPPRRVNRKVATPPIKTRAKKERAMPAPRKSPGNGFAGAIAELEARRTAALDQVEKFDRALETLRALA